MIRHFTVPAIAVTFLALVFTVVANSAALAVKDTRAFLLLRCDTNAEARAAVDSLAAIGIRVVHVLSPQCLISEVPLEMESQVLDLDCVSAVHRASFGAPSDAPQHLADSISAWNHLYSVQTTGSEATTGAPLVGDAFIAERPSLIESSSFAASAAPGTYETSEFMVGSVAVGVIMPESVGGSENWSAARQTTVFNEIVQGLNWWSSRGGSLARLTFYYDQRLSIPTQYEPIKMNGTSDQSTWVADIMLNMGYSSGTYMDRVRAYVNNLRDTYQTDWAYCFIVVDSYNDSDGRFQDGYFAWAYVGGPYSIMTYDNDGWGISSMDRVARHESGHIFGAGDEYCSPGYACCNFGYYGYLNIYNGNCELDNPNSVACVMKSNSDAMCVWTNDQVGWRDTDADGLPDTIDNTVSLTISDRAPQAEDGSVTYFGYANDVPCPSPTRTDVTINSIATAHYRVDGGDWIDAQADDGAFDEDTEDFSFTTTPLSSDPHLIEVQAVSTSGNVSAIYQETLAPVDGTKVSKNAPGPVHDGITWSTAYLTIQEGLDNAVQEVWVAEGVYEENVIAKPNVGLYGGFGGHEVVRRERDRDGHPTVIDGSYSGPTITCPAGSELSCVIDGFTIRNGSSSYGGGIKCSSSTSPTITNNAIIANVATTYGGGIYCYGGSPHIVGNFIAGNTSDTHGGGIYVGGSGSPAIRGNTINGNEAVFNGGGIYAHGSTPVVAANVFIENTAGRLGGAIASYLSTSEIINNVIVSNTGHPGGGIYCYKQNSLIVNNTIVDNHDSDPSADGAAITLSTTDALVANNIIASNQSGIFSSAGIPTLRCNDVYSNNNRNYVGLMAGLDDISSDPGFVNMEVLDFRLAPSSACIDSGSDAYPLELDYNGAIRPQDGNVDTIAAVDIGAYEYPLSLALAKQTYSESQEIAIGGVSVTAVLPGEMSVFVETHDRSSGIRVLTSSTLIEEQVVNVLGTIHTAPSGERYIMTYPPWPVASGSSCAVQSLGMPCPAIGGPGAIGPDNMGLLITSWGRVKSISPQLVIDDGSGSNISIILPHGVATDPSWQFLRVTGISLIDSATGSPIILVRKQADLLPIP